MLDRLRQSAQLAEDGIVRRLAAHLILLALRAAVQQDDVHLPRLSEIGWGNDVTHLGPKVGQERAVDKGNVDSWSAVNGPLTDVGRIRAVGLVDDEH